jgi:branched-subunit amino acid aminotransferase/4-amino-4-deoxychorismate lyase
MLNLAGHISDGTGENVFIVRDGVVSTRRSPPASTDSPANP